MEYIDIRSDTVTHPTKQMRQSILTAQYGDWAYGQDQTIKKLQKRVAQLFGKQDATFVPSGTFGNQSLMLSVGNPGEQVLVGSKSHLVRYQNGSLGLISRLMARTIPSDQNGFITPQLLKKFIRKIKDNQAPKTTILSLQNPTTQGRTYPTQTLHELVKIAKQEGMHVHLDGARIFHIVQSLKTDVKQLVKPIDSIMFCLSKGLSSPIGSMVVGTKAVIDKVRLNRKRLGGNLRKPGVIAQSCLISLDNIQNFMSKANQSAQKLAQQMRKLQFLEITNKVDINMIFFKFVIPKSQSNEQQGEMNLEELIKFLYENKVKCFLSDKYGYSNRFVTHHYIGEKQIQKVINLLKQFYLKSLKQRSLGN